ncbi:MAG TPA: hypothetical protein VM735_07430, partial [Candidatus Kapabacteria bacterium]|nr:hypothetical protein [Candidatus Kapabacteria bacterium]
WRGIDPSTGHWDETSGRVPLAKLLRVPRPIQGAIGELHKLRRLSTSSSLGPQAEREAQEGRMKLLSAFVDNAWEWIDRGWELDEFDERRREQELRLEEEERIKAHWPDQPNPIERDSCNEELKRLRDSWPADPRQRRRSWAGWWT